MTRYAMVIDTRTCIGCGDCVVACKTENNVPEGLNRDWVVEATSVDEFLIRRENLNLPLPSKE